MERRHRNIIRGALVIGFGIASAGCALLNRDNEPTVTVQDAETATAASSNGISGALDTEAPAYLPTATRALTSGEICAVIGGGINNIYRAVKAIKTDPRYGGIPISENPIIYVKDGSTLDGDPADGSIKHASKNLYSYTNGQFVHGGDQVCVENRVAQGGQPEISATSTILPIPSPESTSIYVPIESGSLVDCSSLGPPLDNAISAACTIGQNETSETTLICDGSNDLNGFVTIKGYDFDPNSFDNPPAVSVHVQVGPINKATPREDFGSSCVDWRLNLPAFMGSNPELFFHPIVIPAPTSMRFNDQREKSIEDHDSLVAATAQKRGTIYADVFESSRQNAFKARNIPRPQSRHGRI